MMATRKILVVDDEPSIRHFLQRLLEVKGCEVHTAGSAEEAIEKLPDVDPDVAMIDMVLPGMNGLRLLGKMGQSSPETVVIVITSQESASIPIKALRLGAFDYLQKPFGDLEQVCNTVERALNKNAQAREVRALLG